MTENLMGYRELAAATGGRRFSFSSSAEAGFSSVCIDSRNAAPGALFVALKGSRQDGHCFVAAAFGRGASGALVTWAGMREQALEETARRQEKELVAVEDTLKGLQNAARAYLEKFPSLVKVAITGSSGKTTVKELAAAIIGNEKKVVKNEGNLNSETGLPLSVFNVRKEHEAGVFELGMNRKGEIAELAAVLKPNIALVTNIGTAHIGILGSSQTIAEEKKQVFSAFTGNETALIPAGDAYRDILAEGVKGRVVFYENRAGESGVQVKDMGLEGSEIMVDGKPACFPLPGKHNLADALAAWAIAKEIPVRVESVRKGLESAKPLFGRSEVIRGPVTVFRDCYNANPESMSEAIAFCDSLDWQKGRKMYVIGSMLELGSDSEEAHRKLGRQLAASAASEVFLYGEETVPAREEAEMAGEGRRFFHTNDIEQLKERLSLAVREGDFVLLKGSRGCALEQLDEVLSQRTQR